MSALVTGLGSVTLDRLVPAQIDYCAQDLRSHAVRVQTSSEQLVGGWRALPQVCETPATPVLVAALEPVATVGAQLSESLSGVSRALEQYAEDIAVLKQRHQGILEDVDAFSRLLAQDEQWRDDRRLVAQQEGLQYSANALARQLEDVIDQCVSAIEAAELPLVEPTRAFSGATSDRPGSTTQPGAGVGGESDDGQNWDLSHLMWPFSDGLTQLTPDEVNAWWAGLAPGAQAMYLASNPKLIGGLDGMPASVRDTANRSRLDSELARLTRERDALSFADRNLFRSGDSDELNEKIDGINAIKLALSKGDRQLLLFDLSGPELFAAVAVGNVDTAKNVAVLVGGTGANVQDNVVDYTDNANLLRERAADVGDVPPAEIATVVWFGYEPPSQLWDATRESYAKTGAPALDKFTKGLAASSAYSPEDLNLTVGGHSYGALTATRGVTAADTPVDNVVTYGAPGVTPHIADTVDKYWMLNEDDPIRPVENTPRYPTTNDTWVEMDHQGQWIDGVYYQPGDGHNYLEDETITQYNFAAIIVGRVDKVRVY